MTSTSRKSIETCCAKGDSVQQCLQVQITGAAVLMDRSSWIGLSSLGTGAPCCSSDPLTKITIRFIGTARIYEVQRFVAIIHHLVKPGLSRRPFIHIMSNVHKYAHTSSSLSA